MFQSLNQHYVEPVRSFNRAARLFLLMIVIDGVIFSAWQLFFNFYMLQSGFTREFLGLVNSMPSAAGLIFGLSLGRLSDRIGRRSSIIIGIATSTVFMLAQITFRAPHLIAGAAFLNGLSNMLFIISQAPLMTTLSDRNNRTMLFSLSFGLQTMSGAVGALFAGQLPALFGALLSVAPHSAAAYQAVLVTALLLGTTSIIPMWLMDEARAAPELAQSGVVGLQEREKTVATWIGKVPASLLALTAKMTAPQILIGFGAAILIPYMNVFFKDRFNISDSLLGILYSVADLLIGIASILGPRLAIGLGGKIRAVAATQAGSLVFLLTIGFAPFLWLSSLGFLLRTALMNMSAPLYSAFCMERTPEQHQGFVNSILSLSWSIGWALGPFISGVVQERYGFRPLFIATAVLYGTAILMIWVFFRHVEVAEAAPSPLLPAPEYQE